MLKSWGWVAHVILVSALGPNPSYFLFWGTFIQLWGLLGQGHGLGLGPGLDKKEFIFVSWRGWGKDNTIKWSERLCRFILSQLFHWTDIYPGISPCRKSSEEKRNWTRELCL